MELASLNEKGLSGAVFYSEKILNFSEMSANMSIEKGTTDRRLVTNILVKKVTKPFADGGYFFRLFIYSISMVTIIEIIINTMYKISKSLIK